MIHARPLCAPVCPSPPPSSARRPVPRNTALPIFARVQSTTEALSHKLNAVGRLSDLSADGKRSSQHRTYSMVDKRRQSRSKKGGPRGGGSFKTAGPPAAGSSWMGGLPAVRSGSIGSLGANDMYGKMDPVRAALRSKHAALSAYDAIEPTSVRTPAPPRADSHHLPTPSVRREMYFLGGVYSATTALCDPPPSACFPLLPFHRGGFRSCLAGQFKSFLPKTRRPSTRTRRSCLPGPRKCTFRQKTPRPCTKTPRSRMAMVVMTR